MNSTHAHFNISACEIGAKLKPHDSVCLPFWKLMVEWSGSDSIVFKSLHSGECFLMAPFLVIIFGIVVWTIAVSGAKQLRFPLKRD